jgi:hypothetical protein
MVGKKGASAGAIIAKGAAAALAKRECDGG